MLQIIIVRENNSIRVNEIKDLGTMTTMAFFDPNTNKIDLSSLASHIGEDILVTHLYAEKNNVRLEYEHEKTLVQIGTDENGLSFVEFD